MAGRLSILVAGLLMSADPLLRAVEVSESCRAVAGAVARNDGRHWPTLHGDVTRSGFYPRLPRGPLELAWRKELYRELVGPRCEVIVADGLAFAGTYAGMMRAWDAETGDERWAFATGGPIGHAPASAEGVLYFGSMDRRLYAVEQRTGRLMWSYEAGEGIWTSPLVHAGCVLVGDRAGVFHALDAATGQRIWSLSTGDRILCSAAISEDGARVIFASEDMRVRCADVLSGELVWTSAKLPGLSMRDYFPVVVGDYVLVTTSPVDGFHEILDRHQAFLLERIGRAASEHGFRDVAGTQAEIDQEQVAIVEYLRQHRDEQTFHVLDVRTGRSPWIAPILYTAGLHNPPTPPCHDPSSGTVYVLLRSAFTQWDGGGEVRPLTGVGTLDLRTGRTRPLEHSYRPREPGRAPGIQDVPFATFNTIGDETQALSCSPDFLFSSHQGFLGSLEFATGQCRRWFGKRDTYGGFYGPGEFGWENQGGYQKAEAAGQPYGIVNEWHGPAKGIASVAGPRVYYISGSQVLCFRGRDEPTGDTP